MFVFFLIWFQTDDFASLRDETQTSSALIETTLASLSTLHLDQVGQSQKEEISKNVQNLREKLENAATKSAELDNSMAQATKIWSEYEEKYRKLTLFIEKCDQFDSRQSEKLAIDPIHWQSDIATINGLKAEIPAHASLAEVLKDKVSQLKDLCNCESDRMGTQLATLEVMLEAIPVALSDRLDLIVSAEELHGQFKSLVESIVARLLDISKSLKESSVLKWPDCKVQNFDQEFQSVRDDSVELKALYSQLSEVIKSRDLYDLQERLKEVSELADRTSLIIGAREKVVPLLNDFKEQFFPIYNQIEQWSGYDRQSRETCQNLAELCGELSIELADSLKLAIQVDQLLVQAQLQLSVREKPMTLRQLTGNLDDQLESIIKLLAKDKELDHSAKSSSEMFERRIEKNLSKLGEINNEIESTSFDQLRVLRKTLNTMEETELAALRAKSKKVENGEKLVENFNDQLTETIQNLEEWRERMQGLNEAQSDFESDKSFVKRLLDSVKKIIADESLTDDRYKLSKLKSAQSQLENAQERANKLKKTKYDLKSMKKDIDYDSESSDSSADSIDQLTDDYMDIQDQVEELIDEYTNLVNLKDSASELGDTGRVRQSKIFNLSEQERLSTTTGEFLPNPDKSRCLVSPDNTRIDCFFGQ